MDNNSRQAAEQLVRLSSGKIERARSLAISEEGFLAITTWVTMVCHHKRMEVPDDRTFEMTWLEPLSSYHPSLLDEAFRDYLQTGRGEFFDVHAITGRCSDILARREGEKNTPALGCDQCRTNGTGNGFVWADDGRTKLSACPCRANQDLRSPAPPKPDGCDMSADLTSTQKQLEGIATWPTNKPVKAIIAPPAETDEQARHFEAAIANLSPEARAQVERAIQRTTTHDATAGPASTVTTGTTATPAGLEGRTGSA